MTSPSRSQRLEQLDYNPAHTRLLVGSGIGWALDAMDVGLISFVMAALTVQWKLSLHQTSWLGSIGFVGMALGASLGGLLADRIGRRQVFAATLLVYGLATAASALVTGIAALMVLRFIVGLGLGAELPVASTLVSEFAPARIRGRLVVALEAFWAVGWMMAALLGYLVIPHSHNGWRYALAVGIVPTVYAAVIRRHLPESVRFLESKGRDAEAEAAVRGFEEAARPGSAATAPSVPVVEDLAEPTVRQNIWSRRLRGRTAALWVIWFGINLSYYGAFIWIPSLLVKQGFSMVKSFEFTLIMTLAQLPGYALAAWLIEVWGRRATLASFLFGSALAALAYGHAGSHAEILAAGCALSFANLGAWGALYAIGPEIYPTSIRGTGTGAAAAFGRIASIAAPLLVPVLIARGGNGLAFTVFSAAFAVAALACFALPEARNRSLGRV
ncbi:MULTISPECIES: MFS transporter [unclassified Luteococcus]|uniref:MFS transporter n=1 Tax=unclassified Luteococcus TaxID=2639923 RepID=UPI00313AA679